MSTEILDESPLYREWVDKATAEGLKKGLQQGIAEGKAEGKVEGMAAGKAEGMRLMVRRALEGRFSPLPDAVLAALATAPQETLDAIITHIATDTLETVNVRLGLA